MNEIMRLNWSVEFIGKDSIDLFFAENKWAVELVLAGKWIGKG